MSNLKFVAPCLFGLEALVADEARYLGFQNVRAVNGRVHFSGDTSVIARANLWLRCAERVYLNLGEFQAQTFDQLYENVKALPWEKFIDKTDAFPVKGHAVHSQLASVSACQSIIKKAIVDRLSGQYGISWFAESGKIISVNFHIMKDQATLMIDTTGDALHKRGYRADALEAPLRETLAAALVKIARFRKSDILYDPFCGSGTIAIEAAMISANRAPGLGRNFSAQQWEWIRPSVWKIARTQALDSARTPKSLIVASDIDKQAVELTQRNAGFAGVEKLIQCEHRDIRDFSPQEDREGLIICNPPYGERLLEIAQAGDLYRIMGQKFRQHPYLRAYILTSDEQFESLYGGKADKKRKLYNGMIKCDYYQFFKQRNSQLRARVDI